MVSKFQTESCASACGSRLCFYFQTRWYPLGERLKVEQEKLHRKTEASGKAGTDLVFRFDSAFGFLGLFFVFWFSSVVSSSLKSGQLVSLGLYGGPCGT